MTLKNIPTIIILFISAFIFIFWYVSSGNPKFDMGLNNNLKAEISYIAIGDSYTIGLGVNENSRWPNVLVNHLKQEEINISLVANPAVSGYTVRDAIEFELPVVEKVKPDFATVLIGANDTFVQKDAEQFHEDLRALLDQLQRTLTNPKNIVLVTIPDYSKSPIVEGSESSDKILKLIQGYNARIKTEANNRGLKIADIFAISQTMTDNEDYISDGVHPSDLGYAKWEKVIFPVAFELLRK